MNFKISSHTAYAAIITMGVVSLFGDVIYEGGRSLIPEYLEFLGASAIVVGTVGGVGEFIGYALRLVSGSFADRTRAYWVFIFLGYGLVAAVPFLGLSPSYTIAIIFVLLERAGKAIRTPSRDTVISIVSKDIGAGKAFGIHEFLDQIGAIAGPLMVATVMFYSSNNYSTTFLVLFIPFALLLSALSYTYRTVGTFAKPLTVDKEAQPAKLSHQFYLYSAAIGLSTLGLLPVSLILYQGAAVISSSEQWLIPVLYAVVQAVGAPLNLVAGATFDRVGVKLLVVPLAVSFLPILFISYSGLTGVVLACIAYSIVLGLQESVYRAAVVTMVPPSIRSTAYGIFNTFLGLGILAAGPLFGFFIESQLTIVALTYVAVTQIVAIGLLLHSTKMSS